MNKIADETFRFYASYIKSLKIDLDLKTLLLNPKQGDYDFYLFFPYVFADSFAGLNDYDLKLLSVSCYLYFLHLTIFDEITDKQSINPIVVKNIATSSFCQEESIKILSELFNLNSKFWTLWYKRKHNFNLSLYNEKFLVLFSEKEYFDLADLKGEMTKSVLDSLYILSNFNNKTEYENLIKSCRYFSIGSQIIDDIQDIIEDYENHQFNWILNTIKDSLKKKNISLTKEALKKELYSSGIALLYYKKAHAFLNKALYYVYNTRSTLWQKLISKQLDKNSIRIDTLIGFQKINTIKTKIFLKSGLKTFPNIELQMNNDFFKSSLLFLINEHHKNYIELKHFMYLSSIDGFNNKNKVHVGEVFQLAILTDIYIDIQNQMDVDLNYFIQENIKSIKKYRSKEDIGAWSYFPSVNEIAPDIDDLGQIIQVLHKKGEFNYIKKYCLPLIDFVANNCFDNKIGSFFTWILPKENKNTKQVLQNKFNMEKWGTGPDIEAVANFIYSIQLLGSKQHNTYAKSINFILKNQNKEGYWDSRWYYGKYYGTYVCVRSLIKESNKSYTDYLKKASDFLVKTQNTDGGWGLKKDYSDPLNTAFGILILKLIDKKAFHKIIEKAIIYIHKNRQPNYSWQPINFIKPRLNDPYRSSTLTTAYVLKALL
ncbi:prenyltransferase/squalene oxidase repeat-containing protein [Elizabethkingia meningoseptica]|uniref:prenyltransferase/squalene oxidase repeat-containing protein n=1 Tax=Elizabethkingia meningoseptica TaxID=238 RepID=UPI000937B981|nr:prenyltransferase/squalene oxidase repeat-containing protein [Elizabethkingia meningoseptica]MDE5488422.1 hypothetical protein [Elizabethkingia meningoseptica]MVW93070.1 hypothetical protein [Elizabethkingia meningoseptica]